MARKENTPSTDRTLSPTPGTLSVPFGGKCKARLAHPTGGPWLALSAWCLPQMKEPSMGDRKEINPGTTPRTESQRLHFYTLWSLNKLLPVFRGTFSHPPLNDLKIIKCRLWAGWPSGKIDLLSILLVKSDSHFWARATL